MTVPTAISAYVQQRATGGLARPVRLPTGAFCVRALVMSTPKVAIGKALGLLCAASPAKLPKCCEGLEQGE